MDPMRPIRRAGWKALKRAGYDVRRASTRTGVSAEIDLAAILGGSSSVKVIFDVGANVGQSALRFRNAFPHAAITCFEPVTASFVEGQRATSTDGSVQWHQAAVGSTDGTVTIFSSGTSQLASRRDDGDHTEKAEVEVVRLDDFCAGAGVTQIDLLKTDTEGFDLDVLRGAESLLSSGRVGAIFCEVGFSDADQRHSAFSPIAAFLEPFGYRLFHFYGMSEKGYFDLYGHTYADAIFARAPQV